MSRLLVIAAVVGCFGLLSCKSSKEIRRQTEVLRRPASLIDATKTEGLQFEQVSIKAGITITTGKEKTSFKATIRMQRDSLIWSTITFFGIAGAKLMLTRDSLLVVNYKDKNYLAEDFSTVQEYLQTSLVTLNNLQSILLGELPELKEFEKLKLKLEGDQYYLATLSERRLENDWLEKKLNKLEKKIEKQEEQKNERGLERMEKKQEKTEEKYENMALEVWVDPISLKVEELAIKDYHYEAGMKISYSDFREIGEAGVVPHKISIDLTDEKPSNIEIVFSKVTFDMEKDMPFNIPNTYKRVKM